MNDSNTAPEAACPECGGKIELWMHRVATNTHRWLRIRHGGWKIHDKEIKEMFVVDSTSRDEITHAQDDRTFLKCGQNCGFEQDITQRQYMVTSQGIPGFTPTPIPVQESLFHGDGEVGDWTADSDVRG